MGRKTGCCLRFSTPAYSLKFTALDGRQVDFEQLRGKAVLLVFWSTTSAPAVADLATIRNVYQQYRSKGFEVIGVSYDKEADRDKVVKFVKDKRLPWPQYFDGQEAKNAFGQKLNVRTVPVGVLFDKKGMLASANLRANRLEGELKRVLAQ